MNIDDIRSMSMVERLAAIAELKARKKALLSTPSTDELPRAARAKLQFEINRCYLMIAHVEYVNRGSL